MQFLLSLSAILGVALAASRTSAPSGSVIVKKSNSSGEYSVIQDAVNYAQAKGLASIFINPGTYNEQVSVTASKALTIYGYTSDTTTYASNQVTITHGLSQANGLTNDQTATLRAESQNFKLYNVNVVNSYGKGSQALALSANAGNQGYYGCQFRGYQDTVLAQTGYQLYSKSYIEGSTDFIFGQHASAWFEKCDIGVLAASLGYVTASGRASSSDTSYYVINNSNVKAASGNTVAAGAYYLGRPWGAYARVVFQNTALSSVINSAGWHIWNTGDERTSNVYFGEYKNTGTGASGTRASFAKTLSSAVTIESILGSSYKTAAYVDTAYL